MWKKSVKQGCFEGQSSPKKQFSTACLFQSRDIGTDHLPNQIWQTLDCKSFPQQLLQKNGAFMKTFMKMIEDS